MFARCKAPEMATDLGEVPACDCFGIHSPVFLSSHDFANFVTHHAARTNGL